MGVLTQSTPFIHRNLGQRGHELRQSRATTGSHWGAQKHSSQKKCPNKSGQNLGLGKGV